MRLSSLTFLAVLILAGCSTQSMLARLDNSLVRGDCAAAVALIDGSAADYGSNAELLYLLDAAMVHLQCRDLEAAQGYFQRADDLARRLWTESLSRHALAMVTNDRLLPYAGEDFERVLMHLMSAIGYLTADQLDEALVEMRRLDTLLVDINAQYAQKNVYREDAFARYLSGILHETDGDWDTAFIDYRRAARLYRTDYAAYGTPLPQMLVEDLVRAAGVVDRLADIEGLVPDDRTRRRDASAQADQGLVVCIAFAGDAPRKVQDMLGVPTPHGPVGIAFPRMTVTAPHCSQGHLVLENGGRMTRSDLALVEDVNRIAVKNLDDRKGRILAKAVARAVAKQVAINGVGHSADDRDLQHAIEIVLNLVNILALEKADTRSWQTLPGQIRMTRVRVPAGEYRAVLDACGQRIDLGTVRVDAGRCRFLFRDFRYPALPPMAGER